MVCGLGRLNVKTSQHLKTKRPLMGLHLLTHTFLFWSSIKMDPYQNPSCEHCKKTPMGSSPASCLLLPSSSKRFSRWLWRLWRALGISALIERCRRRCWGHRGRRGPPERLRSPLDSADLPVNPLCLYGRQQTLQPLAGCVDSFVLYWEFSTVLMFI